MVYGDEEKLDGERLSLRHTMEARRRYHHLDTAGKFLETSFSVPVRVIQYDLAQGALCLHRNFGPFAGQSELARIQTQLGMSPSGNSKPGAVLISIV